MPSHSQIMTGLNCFAFFWAFCLMICSFVASQRDYVRPDYEGDGTNRMFKVDYGTTFTGVTTSFAAFGHFYFLFKQLKGLASEGQFGKIVGATGMLVVMMLQCAFVYGNELLVVQEIDTHKSMSQGCGSSRSGCHDVCSSGDANGGYWVRDYTPNKNLQTTLEAAVTFAVFLFLTELVMLVLFHLWKDELADPDYAEIGSGYSGAGGGQPQEVPAVGGGNGGGTSPADGSYQKL